MAEAIAVVVVLAFFGSASWLAGSDLLVGGAALCAVGLVGATLIGARYHLALRTALLASGRLPRAWWLSPSKHHRAMPPDDPRTDATLRWFHRGLVAMAVCGAGLVLATVGLCKMYVNG